MLNTEGAKAGSVTDHSGTSRGAGGTRVTHSRRGAIGRGGGLLAGGVLWAAAGCGAPGSSGSGGLAGGAGTTNAAAVRLTWQVSRAPGYEELARWAIGEFKKQYPNATIETTLDAGNVDKTLTTLVAGEGPDVIHAWGYTFWQLAAKGQVANLAELARGLPKADTDDFVEAQWKGFVIPTTSFRFGMPAFINMVVLYYNKALFQQRGQAAPTAEWDRETYAQMLRRMTSQEGGQPVWGGFVPANWYARFQAHVLAHGGHVVDPQNLTKTQLDLAPAQAGLEWLRARLWDDRSLGPVAEDRRPWQPMAPIEGFYQGSLATVEDGVHQLQAAAERMPAGWDIAHLPKGPANGGRRATLGTTDGWGLWRESKVRDAAWALLRLTTSRAYYDQQSTLTGLVPSRKSALEGWAQGTRQKRPALQNVDLKVVTDALTTLNYPTADEIFLCQGEAERVLQPALNAVFRDGERPVSHFRDVKPDVERAAASCGLDSAQVFK